MRFSTNSTREPHSAPPASKHFPRLRMSTQTNEDPQLPVPAATDEAAKPARKRAAKKATTKVAAKKAPVKKAAKKAVKAVKAVKAAPESEPSPIETIIEPAAPKKKTARVKKSAAEEIPQSPEAAPELQAAAPEAPAPQQERRFGRVPGGGPRVPRENAPPPNPPAPAAGEAPLQQTAHEAAQGGNPNRDGQQPRESRSKRRREKRKRRQGRSMASSMASNTVDARARWRFPACRLQRAPPGTRPAVPKSRPMACSNSRPRASVSCVFPARISSRPATMFSSLRKPSANTTSGSASGSTVSIRRSARPAARRGHLGQWNAPRGGLQAPALR
jgi:hypothetical protein